MPKRLFLGTRKGLFFLERGASGWAIARTAFLGDPVTMLLPDGRDGALYAGLRTGHFGVKLHRSADGGATWEEVAAPAFPAQTEDEKRAEAARENPMPWSVDLIWALEAGGADEPGALWAGTLPAGLFRSDDRGATWTLVRSLWDREERGGWMGGGYDWAGIHSISLDPRDGGRVAVAISTGGVWLTEDRGATWALRASGMRAAYMPPQRTYDPNVQDVHRLVRCPAAPDVFFAQHHNGLFKSEDGARSWTEIETAGPSTFGFAAAVHPRDPRTAWFVPAVKDELRVPVDGALVVTRTRDGGKSFETLRRGLPQRHAYDLVYRHGLDVDETGEVLAIGSTTGTLYVSEDGGDSFTLVSAHLPPIYSLRFG